MLKWDDFCNNWHLRMWMDTGKGSPKLSRVHLRSKWKSGWDLFGFLSFDLVFLVLLFFFLSQKDSLPKLTKTQLCTSFFSETIQGKHADFLQCLPLFLPRVSGISMDSKFPSSEAFSGQQTSGIRPVVAGQPFIQYTMFITIMAAAPLPSERVQISQMEWRPCICFFSCKISWQVFIFFCEYSLRFVPASIPEHQGDFRDVGPPSQVDQGDVRHLRDHSWNLERMVWGQGLVVSWFGWRNP